MAYPTTISITYSYTGFAASLGTGAFPGPQLDADMANVETAILSLDAFIQAAFRSDGVLKSSALPGSVDLEQYFADNVALIDGLSVSAAASASSATVSKNTAVAAAATATNFSDTASTYVISCQGILAQMQALLAGGGGGGAVAWGAITGTLSAQTDLLNALNGKAAVSHTHAQSEVTGLVAALAGKEVSGAATAAIAAHLADGDPHTQYLTAAEGNAAYSLLGHGHAQSDVTGLVAALAAKLASSAVSAFGLTLIDDVDAATARGTLVLSNVDNTSDASKPVSSATQTALNLKLAASAVSAFGLTLVDDVDAATARGTLGLGTLATQSGTFSGTSSGTNTGDQTITLTGNVTGSGTGSFVTIIAAGVVTNAMLATMAANSIKGNNTAGVAAALDLTVAQVKTMLALAVADVSGAAPLAAPTFTGVPAAPLAALNTNTTQLATTSFVQQANNNGAGLFWTALAADFAGTDVATAQPVFAAANDSCAVLAATTYEMEGFYWISRAAGAVSHTTGILFGGTATFTAIDYLAQVSAPNSNVLTAVQQVASSVATLTTITAANTNATEQILVKISGIVRILAAGTFIPQFQQSVATGGVPTVKRGSYLKLRPLGTNAQASSAQWT